MILLSVHSHNGLEQPVLWPFLADLIMSDKENNDEAPSSAAPSMGKDWGSGFGSGRKALFDNPNDFDIYCDRDRDINYIFHGPDLNCTIDHLEYDPDTQRITVFTNDSQRLDLGARIEWLVRPYIGKEQFLFIVQTKDGVPVEGVEVHLRIKDPDIKKTLN